MKKKEVLDILNVRTDMGAVHTKEEAEKQIRSLADSDEGFEDAVFGLGCSVLAKGYLKSRRHPSQPKYIIRGGKGQMGEMVWRRLELTTDDETEKERLERLVKEKNLSRQDLAVILFGLRVRPGFGKKDFGI